MYPRENPKISWEAINSNFNYVDRRKFEDVEGLCHDNMERLLDLRSYMIENPYVCSTRDKLPKILDIFRNFHLRQLPVIEYKSGKVVGIITRQDIFSYMSL